MVMMSIMRNANLFSEQCTSVCFVCLLSLICFMLKYELVFSQYKDKLLKSCTKYNSKTKYDL